VQHRLCFFAQDYSFSRSLRLALSGLQSGCGERAPLAWEVVTDLLTRIARAKRFAAAMTNDADKEIFTIAATKLEVELLRCESIQLQPIQHSVRVLHGGFNRGRAMSGDVKKLSSDALEILHGARSLPPVEAVEALRPFLEAMASEPSKSKLADASTTRVSELVRSLRENHAASNDLWEESIEATLSFVNEQS